MDFAAQLLWSFVLWKNKIHTIPTEGILTLKDASHSTVKMHPD